MKDIEKQLASTSRAKFPPSQFLETASEISADENEVPASTSKQNLRKCTATSNKNKTNMLVNKLKKLDQQATKQTSVDKLKPIINLAGRNKIDIKKEQMPKMANKRKENQNAPFSTEKMVNQKPKVSTMQAQISKTDGIGSRRQPINTECQVQVSDVLKHPVESQDQPRDSAALKITEKPRIISAITIASKKQEDIPANSANSSLHSPRESDLDDDMDSNASTQEQDRENKSQGDKESKLACNNCKEFRKQTRQLQRQLVDLEIENRKLRKLNANMGEKVVNYFEEVRSTIHNVSKNSAQELERKILSGEDLPVGERNEAMQTIHAGFGIWISLDTYDHVRFQHKVTPQKFIKGMASAIFTDDVLQSSTCKGSRSSHGTSGKPGLPLQGLMALKEILKFWMRDVKKMESSLICAEMSKVTSNVNHKIADLNRKPKTNSNSKHKRPGEEANSSNSKRRKIAKGQPKSKKIVEDTEDDGASALKSSKVLHVENTTNIQPIESVHCQNLEESDDNDQEDPLLTVENTKSRNDFHNDENPEEMKDASSDVEMDEENIEENEHFENLKEIENPEESEGVELVEDLELDDE